MRNFFWVCLSIFLNFIIFLRIPKDISGLSNFATTNSTQQFLTILTGVCILMYFGIAINFNYNYIK